MEVPASCLQVRLEQQGQPDDLRKAYSYHDQTLRLSLEDHSHSWRQPFILNEAASTLETYFEHYGNLTELNRCISYYREALELLPPTNIDRKITLNGLARVLLIRFKYIGDEFDLDQALLHCTTALDARTPGHPERSTSLLTMARILRSRFLPWHDLKNLDLICRYLRAAKDACQPGHPSLHDIHAELSTTLFLRYLISQRSMDLKEALGYHELSMAFGSGGIWSAFRASLSWVQDAEAFRHASAVDAYRTALRLLDRCVTVIRDPELRQQLLRRHAELAQDAFSAAIRYKQPDLAVEMLEQGRMLLWDQLALNRGVLDDLRSSGKQGARLADDFEQLSHQIEYGPREQSGQKSPQQRKELQKSRDAVVMQIRRLDGFGHFFTRPSYSDMQKAATDGPVIVVNASRHLCNAVIIYTTGQPLLVPLPQITLTDVAQLAARFEDIIGCVGGPDPFQTRERQLVNLLAKLWHLVVSPVVDRLLPHTPKGSRIWWCPTGKFAALPLHAAGLYQCMESNLPQLYVSSYTPILSSLIKSRRMKGSAAPCRASFAPSFTAFLKGRKVKPSIPPTPSPTSSTFTSICDSKSTEDIDALHNELPLTCTLTCLVGANATRKHVMRAITEQQWVHFALKAGPNFDLPFESCFPLCDRPIALWEISQVLVEAEKPPEFAFVSVGHESRGSREEGHEVMHLPHALHVAGFQSVVGAMWAVDEKILRRIVSAFYHSLVAESNGMLSRANTAKALNQAVKMVEESIPLEQSIAFVHVGA